jgi:hypothetical protein
MLVSQRKKRTIVLFSLVAASLTGCMAVPHVERAALACHEPQLALCATFATDRRCACASRDELERFLGTFDSAAWPGAID